MVKSESDVAPLSHRNATADVLLANQALLSLPGRPPRLLPDVFSNLHHLPDPTLGEDGHYEPFKEVFGKTTTEEGRPSMRKARDVRKGPFVPSIQHTKNTNLMAQCEDCLKWRLVYSRYKLASQQ